MRVYAPSDNNYRYFPSTPRTGSSKPASEKSLNYLRSLQQEATQLFIQTWTWQSTNDPSPRVQESARKLLITVDQGNVYLPIPEGSTQRDISAQIDALKGTIANLRRDLPKAAPVIAGHGHRTSEIVRKDGQNGAEDGFYVVEEGPLAGIYKVQTAVHGSGRPYAKKLVTEGPEAGSWEIARGMQHKLTPAQILTRETAAKYGELYGMCVRCGATLTAEDSIERFMGPVCYAKTA